MSEEKVKNKKRKFSINFKSGEKIESPLRSIINLQKKNEKSNKLELSDKIELKGTGLSSTSQSLIKLIKTNEPRYRGEKRNQENDINELVTKYEDNKILVNDNISSLQNNDALTSKRGDDNEVLDIPINYDSHIKGNILPPVLKFYKNNESLNYEEQIFNQETIRESSFINNISVNHSDVFDDEKIQNHEVVLCISNLEIDTGEVKKLYLNTNNNNPNNILPSEEKLVHNKKELEYLSQEINEANDSTDKKKLIKTDGTNKKKSIFLIIILTIIIIASVLGIIYLTIKFKII